MSDIIIDTSVLVDIFVTTRSRHSDAKELGKYLIDNQLTIRIPWHAVFEFASALESEKIVSSRQRLELWPELDEATPLVFDPVPIDGDFVMKYYSRDLPYMKAGDSIFVAMARVDGAILITEDSEQYKKAQAVGVDTYRIGEFLDKFLKR